MRKAGQACGGKSLQQGYDIWGIRKMESEWVVSLKVGTSRDPLPTAMLPPPSGPKQSPKTMPPDGNQAFKQALEPVGKILHPKYDKYL